jgi:hypothetical protein
MGTDTGEQATRYHELLVGLSETGTSLPIIAYRPGNDLMRVAQHIPGIGYLTIERPGASQISVPDFQGHLTQHGELWREPLGPGAQGRSRSDALVLATPTAISRLVTGPADTADPNETLAFLDNLSVIWEPA